MQEEGLYNPTFADSLVFCSSDFVQDCLVIFQDRIMENFNDENTCKLVFKDTTGTYRIIYKLHECYLLFEFLNSIREYLTF